jgi:hypothetical protein
VAAPPAPAPQHCYHVLVGTGRFLFYDDVKGMWASGGGGGGAQQGWTDWNQQQAFFQVSVYRKKYLLKGKFKWNICEIILLNRWIGPNKGTGHYAGHFLIFIKSKSYEFLFM